ncbi:MAG: hypothetical protein AB1305_04495 [Candidatus Hadarchaeota archaeon]
MSKNIYTSPQEQVVMNAARNTGRMTITNEQLYELCPTLSRQAVNRASSALLRKGYFHRLKKGLYLHQERPSDAPELDNPFRIALDVFPGYLAFSSALKLYGLLEYEPTTVFIATPRTSKELKIGQLIFKAVAMGERATGEAWFERLWVSSLAKTFFDCFYKPSHAGGYSTLSKAMFEAKFDWREFLLYFRRFASDSLCQRTAYVVGLLHGIGKEVPDFVLDYFSRRVKTRTRLVPSEKSAGKWIPTWQVMDNLGEKAILEWYYGGR